MTRASHRRTEQIGLRLIHHLAPAVTQALNLILAQRGLADGWPARGETAGRGTADHTIPEAAVLEADRLDAQREAILDTIESIEISVNHLAKLVIGIDRTPAAGEEKRCRDGQRKYGRSNDWSTNDQCMELPVKLEMCNTHYMQYYRDREARGLRVEQYFEAATNANWNGGV